MIIGRTSEIQKLMRAFDSTESEFVTVYGRRRVGKTFLVRETFDYKFTFEHSGLANSGLKDQLAAWNSSMRDAGIANPKKPHSWIEAFDQLKDLIRNSSDKRKVVFIDEMPWMDTPHSGFIPALEHFWNGWASGKKDVVLIVCGSATSWIINKLIKNHGGLHGRVTNKIHVKPFSLSECELYSNSRKLGMNRCQIAEAYMIMGGVPYYWSLLDKSKSLAQNVDSLFFNKDGELYKEYDELYASLFRNPESYQEVIQTLGMKKIGMTREELISVGKINDNGKLSLILDDLESCGFIRRYNAFGYKERKSVYQLLDSYTLFYFKFILNNRNNDENFWSHNQSSPTYYAWCGLAFERVCLEHSSQIKQTLGISGISSNIYSWRSDNKNHKNNSLKGAQIDMVIDRADNVISLCEIKYSRTKFEVDHNYYDVLMNKRERFVKDTKTNKAINSVIISANGLVNNTYSSYFQNIITIDDLFTKSKN